MTTGLGLLAKALVVGLVSMPVRGRHRKLFKATAPAGLPADAEWRL